jgi:3-isopropylmalate/(R)-2-methylmalate dehydratase small subunit
MKLKGQVFKFGDDIDTDVIIPAKYLNTTDQKVLGSHCMEPEDPEFPKKVKPGDIIVAGKNFGSGSSREHAPLAIKAAGISLVIAKSFARIFYRNAFNTGLPLLESAAASKQIKAGDKLEIDLEAGVIMDQTTGKKYQAKPIPEFMLSLIKNKGLVQHLKKSARGKK